MSQRRGQDGPRPLAWLRKLVFGHHLDRGNHEIALFYLLAGALSLAALIGLAWVAGFGPVARRLIHPHWFWGALAVCGTVVSYLGYGLAYREVARAGHGERLRIREVGALVATGFAAFEPAGGFSFDVRALRDLGVPKRAASVRVLGLGALEYVVLAPAALVSAVVLLVTHARAQTSVTVPWVIGVPVGTVLALIALRHRERIAGEGRFRSALGRWLEALDEVLRLLRHPGSAALAVGGMTIYWAGEVFSLIACLATFDQHANPSLPAVVVGYATGYALTRRSLPLAGAGVTEVLMPLALVWVGQRLAPSLLAVFAYRLFNLWLPMLPAVFGLMSLRRARVRHRASART